MFRQTTWQAPQQILDNAQNDKNNNGRYVDDLDRRDQLAGGFQHGIGHLQQYLDNWIVWVRVRKCIA